MEDLKNKFVDFFDDAKQIYSQIDAETHTFRSRTATILDNMEEQKSNCHSTIFVPVIESLNARLNCFYIDMAMAKFSFLVKMNELSPSDLLTACQKVASFYINDNMKKN